ncbi:hypothetical protein HanIR_Chr10g0462901 [Helianthus annuus]|nr:hypothetical protein HanIR_Chr10g0462901 [Helianthus annuus]
MLGHIAYIREKSDSQLFNYTVYLAIQTHYLLKVDELCERYSKQEY